LIYQRVIQRRKEAEHCRELNQNELVRLMKLAALTTAPTGFVGATPLEQ
jgi:hypothetical protein